MVQIPAHFTMYNNTVHECVENMQRLFLDGGGKKTKNVQTNTHTQQPFQYSLEFSEGIVILAHSAQPL